MVGEGMGLEVRASQEEEQGEPQGEVATKSAFLGLQTDQARKTKKFRKSAPYSEALRATGLTEFRSRFPSMRTSRCPKGRGDGM